MLYEVITKSKSVIANGKVLFVEDMDEKRKASTLEIAAAWIALGLDYNNCVFYRQSDIPEIPELTWILTCLTAKGLMNRAHAYKAAVQENEEQET